MNAEDILWHLDCEVERLRNAAPLTQAQEQELQRIIERLLVVLSPEARHADAA